MSYFPPPFNLGNLVNVTAQRALNTVYQNGSKPRLVIINLSITVGSTTGGNTTVNAILRASAGTPPNASVLRGTVTWNGSLANSPLQTIPVLSYIIPPNFFYTIVTALLGNLSTINIQFWHELDL